MLRHVVRTYTHIFNMVTTSCFQGVELMYDSGSLFLVLAAPKERNELYEAILSIQPKAGQQEGHLLELTHKWQTGTISNYEYLMKLNL